MVFQEQIIPANVDPVLIAADEVLRHDPGPCGGCGADLADASEVGLERRQVFDLPPMTVRVTEHQLVARRCGCGVTTCGAAPDSVAAPVQYGPRITAIVVYLYVGQFLSKKRTAQAWVGDPRQRRPGCPSCPPGLRPLLLRNDFGAGLTNGESDDGGLDEFWLFCRSCRLSSTTSASSRAICSACRATKAARSS
jgi:transposase